MRHTSPKPHSAGGDADNHAAGGLLRQLDVAVMVGRLVGAVVALAPVERVPAADMRNGGEIPLRWWRGDRPFQPRARPTGRRPARGSRPGHGWRRRAARTGWPEPPPAQKAPTSAMRARGGTPGRTPPASAAPCRPAQAHRAARTPDRNRRSSSRAHPAPALVQPEAERLREPIHVSGQHAVEHARDQHVVEMRHQEQRVVHHVVERGRRQDDAENPPSTKVTMKAIDRIIDGVNRTSPRNMVQIQS